MEGDNMLMLYFSGTGNSKYIAEKFSEKTKSICYSIEDKIDFKNEIKKHDTIGFCYPIYASNVPRIMREFVEKNKESLRYKKLIIFCTQLMFSGDGARVFTDLLPNGYGEVIYAEHFNMPNNICNSGIFSVKNGDEIKKYIKNADKKINRICKDLESGKVKKRGFNKISNIMGKCQSGPWLSIEEKNKSSVKVDEYCIKCGLCARICPMKNLNLTTKEIVHNDNCMICYRCVNACPKKAITVLIHNKPKKQYKGIKIK